MTKTRQEKEKIVKNLVEKLKAMKSVVLANYFGLKVNEVDELRSKLKKEGGEYLVVKKTLLKIALEETGINGVDLKKFEGGIALAFGFEDEILPAKILYEFRKKHEALEIFGGFLGNKFLEKEEIISLAKLPTKNELINQLIASIRGPIFGLINVLSSPLRSFTYILKAIQQAKE